MSIQPVICCICGKPVLSHDEDIHKAHYERKWKVHWACRQIIEEKLDECTGIASERRGLWKKK